MTTKKPGRPPRPPRPPRRHPNEGEASDDRSGRELPPNVAFFLDGASEADRAAIRQALRGVGEARPTLPRALTAAPPMAPNAQRKAVQDYIEEHREELHATFPDAAADIIAGRPIARSRAFEIATREGEAFEAGRATRTDPINRVLSLHRDLQITARAILDEAEVAIGAMQINPTTRQVIEGGPGVTPRVVEEGDPAVAAVLLLKERAALLLGDVGIDHILSSEVARRFGQIDGEKGRPGKLLAMWIAHLLRRAVAPDDAATINEVIDFLRAHVPSEAGTSAELLRKV